MRKILPFDSPQAWYECDAAVISCFDSRFDAAVRELLLQIGVQHPDVIRIAGGAKSLASPQQESDRRFLVDQIQRSIRLHGTQRVILILHSDCGAYGGLAGGFQGDKEAEIAHFRQELARAAAFLNEAIPSLTVERLMLNFEGVWVVEDSMSALL